tara:strand:+ start:3773 stop:4306 length:534 start_codon:yes stop_codon:yes gene_type:complete
MSDLDDKVEELSPECSKVKKLAYKIINEPQRMIGKVREDPLYFLSIAAGVLLPTAIAATVAYNMQDDYSQEVVKQATIWTKNIGFFAVNIPTHLYTHKNKFENLDDVKHETKTLVTSNLFGLVANTILQPLAHGFALDHGIKDPLAVVLTYFPVGGAVTYAKILYDDFKGAIGLKKK